MTLEAHSVEQVGISPLLHRRRFAVSRSWSAVGRRTDLDELVGVLTELGHADGGTRLVEVQGEAGIGKTALLSDFARAARAEGAVVLAAWGGGGRGEGRYGAFAEAFAGDEGTLPEKLQESCRDLAVRIEQYGQDLVSTGSATDWARPGCRIDYLVRGMFERIAATTPLVLILDELHLCDEGSLGLLNSLLRRPPKGRLLVVVGYRDRQVDATLRAALDDWFPQVTATRMHLGALSEEEVGAILGDLGIASWGRQLYEESQGNPAYLKALVAERLSGAGQFGASAIDQTVQFGPAVMFLRELARVSAPARTVAEAAAVVGCEFDAELVAHMLEISVSETLGAIGELIGCDLVRAVAKGPYFTFRHPVVHRAVYYGCELSRRVQLHERADRILRDRGVAVTERAPHVEQRANHGDMEAVDVLDAAAGAVIVAEPRLAASWLATALRVLPRQPQYEQRRSGLLVRLAKARGAAGDLRGCRDTMHEALRTLPREPSAQHAKAVAFTAMVQRLLGTHAETDTMLRAELAALGDDDPVGRAALLFEIAAWELSRGDWAGCCRDAGEALRLSRLHQDRPRELCCQGLIAKAMVSAGNIEAAADHLAAATAILDGMLDGDFVFSLDAVAWVGWADALLERWEDAIRHFDKAVGIGVRTGRQLALPHLLVGQVFALYNRGRLADAHAAAEHAVRLAQQSGSPEQLVGAYSVLAWTDVIVGRVDHSAVSDLAAIGQFRGSVSGFQALALRMLAEARLMSGDPEGCLALVSAVGGPNLRYTDACSRVSWYELLTRAELALGHADEAAKWSESAAACADLLDQPGRNGLASLARANLLLATNPEAALSSAQEALAGLTESGMVLDALRARVAYGLALWHHDRYDDAARELSNAQTAFEDLGAPTLARFARTERRRLAARTSSRSKTAETDGTAAVLTDRERQVTQLVREGLTNRLIAKRLNISEKTVEMHMSKVFAKLGVSNRAAVAAVISRHERDEPVAGLG